MNQLVILWKTVIDPIIDWIVQWLKDNIWQPIVDFFANDGLFIIIDFLIMVFSFIAGAILYVLSFGTIDYTSIVDTIYTINTNIFTFIRELLTIFFANFMVFLGALAIYFTNLGLIYFKMLFAKSKGYTNRVEKLQTAINFYKYPIDIIYRLIQMFTTTKDTENV